MTVPIIPDIPNEAMAPQYTDGASTPTHPTGIELVYDNAGAITAVSTANPLPVNATVTPAANQRVNAHVGDFVDGSDATQGTTTQTKATDGSATSWSVIQLLKGIFDKLLGTLGVTQSGTWTVQPGNTANTTAWKVDGSAVTQPVSGTVTETNSSSIKTDLDTLAGAISSNKAAVKATASGDFVDGSITAIGTTTQTKATDGTTTSWSVVQLLKGIFDKLLGSIAVTGTFWQATQPVSGTVTANAGSGTMANNVTQIGGASLALGAAAAASSIPVVDAAQQGWIAATGTGTVSTDDTLTFASQVRTVALYNASANAVPLEFDTTAAATSWPLQPGQSMIVDKVLCTTIHVFPSATLPINTTSGLYVKGWKA